MDYKISKLDVLENLQRNGMNKFEAINYVSSYARRLTSCYKDNISHKEALSWICDGIRPKNIDKIEEKLNIEPFDPSNIGKFMPYVEEKEIYDAVSLSISQSTQNHHLIYNYNKIDDENKKSRIRILCNIVWEKLHE